MASILQVEQIKGPTSGASANTIEIPSGQTLDVNGTLTGDGSNLTGITTGKVLQVVQDTDSTPRDTTSTTFQDTGLSVSITPSSTSSKILIMVSQAGTHTASGGDYQMRYHLFKDGSELSRIADVLGMTGTAGGFAWSYLDSPATTSAITYATKFAARNSGYTVSLNYYGSTTIESTIIAMEIGA